MAKFLPKLFGKPAIPFNFVQHVDLWNDAILSAVIVAYKHIYSERVALWFRVSKIFTFCRAATDAMNRLSMVGSSGIGYFYLTLSIPRSSISVLHSMTAMTHSTRIDRMNHNK